MFPTKFDRYVEVFGGGGWVLFGRPPDQKGMEVYNDFNSNLANLFYCVKNRTWALLRELGFLPLNSRDEFTVIRDFIDKKEFDDSYLKAELELAEHNLPPPEFEEIKAIMLENAEVTDIKRAAAFFKLIRYSYGSGCTSYGCQPFEATYYSALGENDEKMLLARAIQMFVPGKPQVWYLDLFAGKNDYEAVKLAGPNGHKEINRTNLSKEAIKEGLKKKIVQDQLTILRFRNTSKAFGFASKLTVGETEAQKLFLRWENQGEQAELEADLLTYDFVVYSKNEAGVRKKIIGSDFSAVS